MTERLKSVLHVVPAAAMVVVATVVLVKAWQGAFNSMMGFPVVFAAITTALCVVALFVGPQARRVRSVGILGLAALIAWGAAWSHHEFFERQREALDRQGREKFAGEVVTSIRYVRALNKPGAGRGPGTFELEKPQILVNIWATWCAPCVQEMPTLERFWVQHRDSGFQVVGVTRATSRDPARRVEELDGIAAFLTEHQVSYPILVVDDDVYSRFNPERLPTSLWLENGTVRDYRVTVDGTKDLLEAIESRLESS